MFIIMLTGVVFFTILFLHFKCVMKIFLLKYGIITIINKQDLESQHFII